MTDLTKEATSEERMNRGTQGGVEDKKQSEAMKKLFILPAAGPTALHLPH